MTRQKTTAEELASFGRFGDSLLVHMSPEEVHGLQALATAAGTELTVNPFTGMPEAFNLRELLTYAAPVAAGIMLGPLGGGAVSGLMSYANDGDLSKALLSGATGAAVGSMMNGVMGGAGGTEAALSEGATGEGLSGALENSTNTLGTEGFMSGVGDGGSSLGLEALPSSGVAESATAGIPSTWTQRMGDKMTALQNTDWSANGGPLFNAEGGVRMAPIIAGGGLLGIAGMNEQAAMEDEMKEAQEREKRRQQQQFNYYQSMAGTMPANMIPAYRG